MLQELRRPTKAAALALRDFFLAEDHNEKEYVCEGKPLAVWWQQKTPGTSYWRCQVPARKLPGNSLALFYSDLKIGPEGEVLLPRQPSGTTAIWQFVGNATRALIMTHLQEQGHKVLMEVDDNYLVPPPHVPGLRRDWRTQIDRSLTDNYSHPAHRKIIRWVDGIIVATEALAERYARKTSSPVFVCPNSIILADWPRSSEPTFEFPRKIGYAGSGSHRYDLGLVERALSWAAHQENTVIYKLGVQESAWRFPHKAFPWTHDLAEYRANLQVLDVGLCPLVRGEWADCKSDIKAMEYLLSGAVPIVQGDSPCYSDWREIVPSAISESDWRKQVKWATRAPADELYEVWKRGYDFLLANKLIHQHIDKWRVAVA